MKRTSFSAAERVARLEFALEAGGIGLWDWRIDTDEFVADDVLHRLVGHLPGELALGATDVRVLIHPDDQAEVRLRLDAHFAGTVETYESEHRMRTRDGGWRWVQDRGRVVARDAAGRPLRMTGAIIDISSRKRAEEEADSRQRDIQTLLDTLPGYAFFKNAESVYVVVNQRFATAVGMTTASIIGRTDLELFPAAMAEKFRADDRRCMDSGEPLSVGEEHMIESGRKFFVDTRKVPLKDHSGAVVGLVGFGFDVTERKRAEDALRESERRLDLALRGADVGMWDWDVAGGTVTLNARSAEIHGLPAREFTSPVGWWQDVLHPEDLARLTRDTVALLEGRAAMIEDTLRVRRADGEAWILSRGGVTGRAPDGRPLRVTGTHTDVTQRKRAEDALHASEERFRAAFESAPIGVCLASLDGRFLRVNRAWCELLGYREDELLGRDIIAITHPEDRAATARRFSLGRVTSDGEPAFEKRFLRKDGSTFWAQVHTSAARDGAGRTEYFIGLMIDIDQRKTAQEERTRLEEQLRQAQKIESIGMLAGGVAHDFNNLLLPILGFAEMARGGAVDARQAHQLSQIIDAALRAKDLVRQLLAFSRKQMLEMRSLDLNDEIRRFEPILRRVVREDIRLDLELAPDLGPVRGDSSQIQQILMNLVVNAHDAMPGGGRMRIATAEADLGEARDPQLSALPAGRYVVVTVADTGEGMDANVRAHLFEPFFTTKEPGKGTGLGLATVHGIVKQHGGEIAVRTAPGTGTSFAVWLPRARSGPTAAVGEATRRIAGGDERVLVVEDEQLVRDLVSAVLSERGYRVTSAADPDEALRLIAAGAEFDLLLTDVIMPGMDGRELHARLKTLRPALKALYMSGYTGDVLDAHHLDASTHLLQKPFVVAHLIAKVRETLDG